MNALLPKYMHNTVVVVASCDGYSDAWHPMNELMKTFWKNRPRTVFVTNHSDAPDGQSLKIGQDLGWSPNLLKAVSSLRETLVVLLQEDFFLSEDVSDALVAFAVETMRSDSDIACFRLFPCPGPLVRNKGLYGEILRDEPYRVSCQAAIWRPDYLGRILAKVGKTAADFELQGTNASRNIGGKVVGFFRENPKWAVNYICSAISRGRWNPDALALCDKMGIQVDASRRPVDR